MRVGPLLFLLVLACTQPDEMGEAGQQLDFEALAASYPNATREQSFVTRDLSELPFRHYDGLASISLILLHGSGAHSIYLSEMAAAIAATGAANVYTPDLRGHGRTPERRGDIDYMNQLEDDVSDLISFIRQGDSEAAVVLGGHSSGGGLAIRVAGGDNAPRPDAYLLLAPFLQYDAPTVRPQSGGWAHPQIAKIILLTLLNQVGVTAFNNATVLTFDLPASRQSGLETLSYTYRLMNGFAPRDYRADLRAMCEPVRVVVGHDDAAFYADQFGPVFEELAPHASVDMVPGVGHLELVAAPQVHAAVVSWLRELPDRRSTRACS